MNKSLKKTLPFVRIAFSLMVVATVMAVSCPQPGPNVVPVDPIDPVVTKSVEQSSFESCTVEGFYKNGICQIPYNPNDFQKAVNPIRKTYRIQSDDQKRYMNVLFSEGAPRNTGDECVCTINYCPDGNGETMLVVRFVAVKIWSDYVWLWNELQKVGIIVPMLPV